MKNNKYGLTVTSIQKYGFEKAVQIWERYDRKCSVCGSPDYLAVHHIDGSGNTDHRNDDIDNLQLICQSCHMSLHSSEYWAKQAEKRGGYLHKGREKEYYKTKEYREWRAAYMKKYRQEHTPRKRTEYLKQWRETHQKEIQEYQKQYWVKRKLRIKAKKARVL